MKIAAHSDIVCAGSGRVRKRWQWSRLRVRQYGFIGEGIEYARRVTRAVPNRVP